MSKPPDSKRYAVKEIFVTLQGEGSRAGARSVFLRLAGCNLWDGRPEHRDRGAGACSSWCDTDFVGGMRLSAQDILEELERVWGFDKPGPFWVVISGGEPCLQIDEGLINLLLAHGWHIAVETNGSVANPALRLVDHVTVSPKLGPKLTIVEGTELKVVLPGGRDAGSVGWTDADLHNLRNTTNFRYYFVQPQDPIDPGLVQVSHLHGNLCGPESAISIARGHELCGEYENNLRRCLDFIHRNADWRLSLQTHKYIELP